MVVVLVVVVMVVVVMVVLVVVVMVVFVTEVLVVVVMVVVVSLEPTLAQITPQKGNVIFWFCSLEKQGMRCFALYKDSTTYMARPGESVGTRPGGLMVSRSKGPVGTKSGGPWVPGLRA